MTALTDPNTLICKAQRYSPVTHIFVYVLQEASLSSKMAISIRYQQSISANATTHVLIIRLGFIKIKMTCITIIAVKGKKEDRTRSGKKLQSRQAEEGAVRYSHNAQYPCAIVKTSTTQANILACKALKVRLSIAFISNFLSYQILPLYPYCIANPIISFIFLRCSSLSI